MSSHRWPVVNGLMFRMTVVDACGVPLYGPRARLVSDGFVSVAATVNVDDGTAIEGRNARGTKTVKKNAEPKIDDITLNMVFDKVDPEAFGIATGQSVIYDPADGERAIGFKTNSDVRPQDSYLALELWSEVPGGICVDGSTEYGYLLYPFLAGGVFSDYTLENGLVSFGVNNMRTQDGSQWAEGPYNVMTDADGDPSPLTGDAVIEPNDHFAALVTTFPPPVVTDGAVPLDDPDTTAATTATAGTPGTFNGNRPDSSMSGIIASPTSAWTTGQYVETENGADWHWTGTAWAAGPVA